MNPKPKRHGNTEPSRRYTAERCRDYRRGTVPLITGQSAPPEREDIVQPVEKSTTSYTETNVDITIATWEYAAIAVESIVKVQGNRDLLTKYAGKMGYALDLAVDDVVAGLVDDFSTNTVGTLAVSLTYDDVLTANQYLDDVNVPEDGRVIVASPAQIADWMKLDVFIRSDYSSVHGQAGQPAGRAYSRSWLGVPVYKSVNVEGSNGAGHDNGMFHKEALALVMQMKPKTNSHYDIDYLVDKVVMEQLYGAKEMRDDHGCFMRGL